MRKIGVWRRLHLVAVLAIGLSIWLALPAGAHAFGLGFEDARFDSPVTAPGAFGAMQAVHGSWIRRLVNWSEVAPTGNTIPAGFNPTNPADPRYSWTAIDTSVRVAAQYGANLVVALTSSPGWAQGPGRPSSSGENANIGPGAWDPNPTDFAAFAHAAAARYNGHFPDPVHPGAFLPRVQYWEIWNEENLPLDLAAPDLVSEYRALLNAGYGAIKSVDSGDVVSVGGLAPVSFLPPLSISPLKFAAQLMCLQRIRTSFVRARSCPVQARFDAFADHPYSLAATPTKHAYRYDDVLIGDLGKITKLLARARHLHTVSTPGRIPLWITEWSWFTNPPNSQVGDRASTAARYVAYSMYEMWRAGTSFVTWFLIQDPSFQVAGSPSFTEGGGLYNSSGQPKLMLRAFAFPFVASVNGGRGFAWGRVPSSAPVRVLVQRRSGRRWITVAIARAASGGTFRASFRADGNRIYRAWVNPQLVSLAYNSAPIPPKRTHLFQSG